MKCRIYGHSDDLVEIEIDGKAVEEIGVYDDTVRFTFGAAVDHGDPNQTVLTIRHDGKDGWTVGIVYLREDNVVPLYPVTVDYHAGYSPGLSVDVPSDCPIVIEKGDGKQTWKRQTTAGHFAVDFGDQS